MRSKYLFALLCALTLVAYLGCGQTTLSTNSKPHMSDSIVTSFQPAEPQYWELPNGLAVYFVEDNELPIAQGTLYYPGGTYYQSSNELGMLSTMGAQMREGGAGDLSPDELDRELEKLAAGVSSSMGSEYGTVSFSGLSSDFEKIFSMFADVVLRPRFDELRLKIAKGKTLEGIKRRVEDPSTVASIALSQLIFPDTPYGYISNSADIVKISRLDLLRMHRRFVKPQGAVLAINGKINSDTLKGIVAKYLGEWEGSSNLPEPTAVKTIPKAGIYHVELPFTQSTVYMAQLGLPRFTADHYAIGVFNDVFGEAGFGSRLFTRIRSEMGLAYGLYGAVGTDLVRGKNVIAIATKTESVGDAIVESLNVLQEMRQSPVTDLELSNSKRTLENSFVFNFDSSDAIARRAAMKRIQKFPEGYDQKYISSIRAVTASDIMTVAEKHWDLSKFVIVVVGEGAVWSQLEKLNERLPAELRNIPIRKVEFNEKLKL